MSMVKQCYASNFFFRTSFGGPLFFLGLLLVVLFFFVLGIPTVHSRALEGLCAGEAYANVVMAVAGASIAGPGSEHVREEWLANPLPMHAGL